MKLIQRTKSQYSKVKSLKLNSPLVTRLLIGSIILLIVSFFMNIKLILFLLLAIFFNSWLAGFQIKRNLPTDFELSTFTTVMITLRFGLGWGIVNAIFSKLVASIYTGNVVADHFFMIATYINAAFLSSLFSGVNIFVLGSIIILTNCLIMFFISKRIGIDLTANLSYTFTNFVFNSLIFSIFAEIVLKLLG